MHLSRISVCGGFGISGPSRRGSYAYHYLPLPYLTCAYLTPPCAYLIHVPCTIYRLLVFVVDLASLDPLDEEAMDVVGQAASQVNHIATRPYLNPA